MSAETAVTLRRALFLDRDGVINVDHGHVHRKEDFEFIDGIVDLVRRANAAGWVVVVVTNQAGIAKGYYGEADFHVLMEWMCQQFEQQGARIDAVYHCPHHPEFGALESRQCHCRKPGPDMLLQAAAQWHLDLPHSVLIGDKPTDMAAASAAGVGAAYLFEADFGHSDVNRFAAERFNFLK